MALKLLLAGLTPLLIVNCSDRAAGGVTAEEAIEAGNEAMAENLPGMNLSELRIGTVELPDRWQISYDYPEGSTGGPVLLEVSKETGEVINGRMGQ